MRTFFVLIALLVTAHEGVAQGLVGVYFDVDATRCTLADNVPRLHQIEIIASSAQIGGVEFKVAQFSGATLTYVAQLLPSNGGSLVETRIRACSSRCRPVRAPRFACCR